MEEDLLKIIRHYGLYNQLKYIHSEYFELDEAIIDYKYVEVYKDSQAEKYHKKHIAEEIADVVEKKLISRLERAEYAYG